MLKQLRLWAVASLAVITLLLGVGMAPFSVVHAAEEEGESSTTSNSSVDEACLALEALGGTKCDAVAAASGESQVIGIAKTVINILSIIVGIASVIVIVIAGLRFVTSGGDSSSVSTARSMIIYAIVGLVIVMFAQAIVVFVLDEVK